VLFSFTVPALEYIASLNVITISPLTDTFVPLGETPVIVGVPPLDGGAGLGSAVPLLTVWASPFFTDLVSMNLCVSAAA
jgi:hypothetical protein